MKYKASIEFKGISINHGKEKIDVPGDINVQVEGEYSWLDLFFVTRILKGLVNFK